MSNYVPRMSWSLHGQVADAKSALLRSKIERHDRKFILRLGEKNFVIFPIVDILLTQKHDMPFCFLLGVFERNLFVAFNSFFSTSKDCMSLNNMADNLPANLG